jgi:ABC-type lipoprotein release transport system permease subunit
LMITSLGLMIGIPLGIIAGRTSWFVVVDPIGVATDTSRSFLALVAVGVAALLIAAVVALGPGWRAARLRPARALRVE